MSSLNLRLPDSLHEQVRQLAKQDSVSLNQFITLAVAEKVSAIMTLEYIEQRAQRGSKEKFARVLDKIAQSDAEPIPEDHLPDGATLSSS